MIIENLSKIKDLYENKNLDVTQYKKLHMVGCAIGFIWIILSMIIYGFATTHLGEVISYLLIGISVLTFYEVNMPTCIGQFINKKKRQKIIDNSYTTLQYAINRSTKDHIEMKNIIRILILPANKRSYFSLFIEDSNGIYLFMIDDNGKIIDENNSHYYNYQNLILNYTYAINSGEIVYNHGTIYKQILEDK